MHPVDGPRVCSQKREVDSTMRPYCLKSLAAASLLAAAGIAMTSAGMAVTSLSAADDIFQQSRAVYAALHSYSDTGVLDIEYATSRERHTFTTRFKAPRRFYFDFRKSGGDRFAIWSDGEKFHDWWRSTGVQNDYQQGRGVSAFNQAGYLTLGSGLKIPALLFPGAGLQGAFTNLDGIVPDGEEDVDGRRCYRLVGTTKDVYTGTGREVNVRQMTVWVDAETLLIRKVFEDAPKGTAVAAVMRITTRYEPQANPALDDNSFQFVSSASK